MVAVCVLTSWCHSISLPPANEVWDKVIFLPPAMKLGQGYVFTDICHSVNRGELSASVHAGIPPPTADTPLEADTSQEQTPPSPRADTPHPPEQTPPRSRHPTPEADTPRADTPRADTPWSRHTPRADTPQSQSMLGDTVNTWAVCILLECNLVTPVCHSVHRGVCLVAGGVCGS